jgi:hypothetical protein
MRGLSLGLFKKKLNSNCVAWRLTMGAQARLRLAFVCFASILLSAAPVAASSFADGNASIAISQSTPRTSQASAAGANAACSSLAAPRITGRVDDNVRAGLQGNLHPLARAEYDQGKVDDNLPLEHIMLLLRRSAEQEIALSTRIDQMHNRRSPYYHQWLQPQDVGACYGVADPDIAVVIGWLQKHGFKIDSVPAGKTLIIFSGTAGQVREAFQTEIHNLNVKGEMHIANMSAPQIPAALTPVVTGIRSLHNFFSKPNMRLAGTVKRNSATGRWEPLDAASNALPHRLAPNNSKINPLDTFSSGGGAYFAIAPQDLYTIYNETPLLNATSPINGAGQTLAVIERTDIVQSDLTMFRSEFGLAAYPTTPNATQGGVNFMDGNGTFCADPGISSGDEGEADLDIDWIGVTAPNAIIDYVACASTNTSDGTDLSLTYVINNLASSVSAMSSSYGGCEPAGGSSEDAFYTALFGQAVAQGQTVVVAAGDSGSDACDRGDGNGPNSGQDLGITGISVQSQSSSAYAVAAGGSDFSDIYQNNTGNYWSASNGAGFASALSYVPEMAWNNTCTDTLLVDYYRFNFSLTYPNGPEGLCNDTTHFNTQYPFTTLGGGTGGTSQFISIPTWQSVYGVGLNGTFTSTSNRNLPDVSMYAAIGLWNHFLLYCDSAQGGCDYSNTNDALAQGVGGTSAVAPMLTGIIGLINEANPSGTPGQPTRQGQADYTFYALASAEYGTAGAENTSTAAPSAYTCEGSNINAISKHGSVFPSCTFYSINRTSQLGTSTCVDGVGTGCLVDNNGGACGPNPNNNNEYENCYRNESTDTYGILSVSNNSFESAFNQSGGYNAATGLGSVNIANLVNNWTAITPQFPSTTSVVVGTPSIFTTGSTSLTATVTATGRGGVAPPLGDITFYSGSSCTGTALGSAGLVPASSCTTSCNATASVSSVTGAQIGAGARTIAACFSGDGANDAPSNSTASVTVTQTTLTAAPTPTSLSIAGGQSGTVSLALSANATVPTAVTLACSGMPADASCTFSSFTALPATVTMTITTTTADAALILPQRPRSVWMMASFVLPGLLLLPGGGLFRRRRTRRLCGLMLLSILTLILASCGGGGGSPSSSGNNGGGGNSSSQNYTVTVTASATGVTTAKTTVAVTVTQ